MRLRTSLLFVLLALSAALPADEFRWEVSPYLWNANFDLTTGASGAYLSSDAGYNFFSLDNLDQVVSFRVVHHGRSRTFVDYLSVSYSDEFGTGVISPTLAVDASILELGGYLSHLKRYGWEPLIGARYYNVEAEVDVGLNPRFTAGDQWIDPFIGVSAEYPLAEKWKGTVRMDVGGFGVGSRWSSNLELRADYALSRWIALGGGYRYLAADFDEPAFLYDATLDGLELGFSIRF